MSVARSRLKSSISVSGNRISRQNGGALSEPVCYFLELRRQFLAVQPGLRPPLERPIPRPHQFLAVESVQFVDDGPATRVQGERSRSFFNECSASPGMSANVPKALPSMLVPVVDVRVVDVGMAHRLMLVRVAVRLAGRVVRAVFVLVVFVVDMAVVVGDRIMVVFVGVPLGQVQPDPDAHEGSGQEEGDRGTVPEEKH